MAVDKTKKPTAEFEVTCPHCLSLLSVEFWKQRIGEPDPVDYEVGSEAAVVKQGRLFPEDKERIEKAKATKKTKLQRDREEVRKRKK